MKNDNLLVDNKAGEFCHHFALVVIMKILRKY